jgi:hypothetical protein
MPAAYAPPSPVALGLPVMSWSPSRAGKETRGRALLGQHVSAVIRVSAVLVTGRTKAQAVLHDLSLGLPERLLEDQRLYAPSRAERGKYPDTATGTAYTSLVLNSLFFAAVAEWITASFPCPASPAVPHAQPTGPLTLRSAAGAGLSGRVLGVRVGAHGGWAGRVVEWRVASRIARRCIGTVHRRDVQ